MPPTEPSDQAEQGGPVSHRLRVTGPPPFKPEPHRPESFTLPALLSRADAFADLTLQDAQEQLTKVEDRVAYVAAVLNRIPTGKFLLDKLVSEDVWLGRLSEKNRSYGFYLAGDRVVYLRTKRLEGSIRILAHEARHVAHHAQGFSTIIEFYEAGSRLPFDGWSYLLLNRSIEADADARAVRCAWELKDAGVKEPWDALASSPEFGRLARAFGEAPVGQRMAAAYDEWFRMGRAYGYDTYLLDWLERLAQKHGKISAQRRLTHEELVVLGERPGGGNYLQSEGRQLDAGDYVVMADDVAERVSKLSITATPARTLAPAHRGGHADDLSWLATAQNVRDELSSLLGDACESAPSVIHVAMVARRADGSFGVLRLQSAPNGHHAWFLRNVARARADAVITTGKILRDEPRIDLSVQGPGELGAGLWRFRRERLGKTEPPLLLVLTHGQGLDPDHPTWASPGRELVFTEPTAAPTLTQSLGERRVEIITRENSDIRSAIAYLNQERGVRTVTVETGPTTSRQLYQAPVAVEELLLAVCEDPPASGGEQTGAFLSDEELRQVFGEPRYSSSLSEDSGSWTLRRYLRAV